MVEDKIGKESIVLARETEQDRPDGDARKTAIVISGGLASASTGRGAPFVSAAGHGLLAEEMIALAERHGIPVERDPALASLLGTLQVGQFLPPELYQAIAELLVFLYDLDANLSIDA